MRRSLSPIVRRELENLDKDADSRKLAMKALKSYVKELDSKAIPLFLAQVSETKDTGSSSGEYTISLYEVLARVHGQKIVPQIDNIMTTIIATLKSSAGSFPLHQACAKVVPAIARYGIDTTTPDEKKRHIIYSLCKPLSDCLLGSDESLSSGAALCLKALVECDNWRLASNDVVNEVCQRVAAALDKNSQINSHMALVMSLAKHNSLTVEAYARLLVRSGIRILNEDAISQKRLSAIHMLNSLMKCLDPKSIYSELEWIIKVMENCQSDQMAYVSGAAFEALQAARKICTEKSSKFGRDVISITGSNFDRRGNIRRRNLWASGGDQLPLTASPESQTVDYLFGHDSVFDSPMSTNQASPELCNNRRSVNRKLWTRDDNGAVNISLKDGIFSEMSRESVPVNPENNELSYNCGDFPDGFAGFLQENGRHVISRSTTPSPQRSRSHINVQNVKIFTTPRKLIHSLQDPDGDPDISDKENRRYRSPSRQCEHTPTSKYIQNGFCNGNAKSSMGSEELYGSSESVSSTNELALANQETSPVTVIKCEMGTHATYDQKKGYWNSNSNRLILLFLLFAIACCFLWIGDDGKGGYNLVPT